MIWFTADLHVNHGNIVKYCHRNIYLCDKDRKTLEDNKGIWHSGEWKSNTYKISQESIANMNFGLINKINQYVKIEDDLYILGDLLFSRQNHYKDYSKLRDSINCKNVYCIWGNHDNKEMARVFDTIDICKIQYNKINIIMCHYAMAVWDKSHRGSWHLYGHSHSEMEDKLNECFPQRRSMDVGVDNIYKLYGEYRPISFIEIGKIFERKFCPEVCNEA